MDLTIEPNKFYRTRDGRKARVYAVDGGGIYPVHGACLSGGEWYLHGWTLEGIHNVSSQAPSEQQSYLIAEWVDAPEVNWPAMPAWVTHIAKDSIGSWYGYDEKPSMQSRTWDAPNGNAYKIHPDYRPKFTGDWKDSLVERPSK